MKFIEIYGFCKIETYDYDMAKGSLFITEDKTRADYVKHRVGVYVVVNDGIELLDLNRIEDIPVNSSTDSLQIRPKIVHCNQKGYYIKHKEGMRYLSETIICSMNAMFDFKIIE